MYSQNEKFDQLEAQLRTQSGTNQKQLLSIMARLQNEPLVRWFDLLSGAFIVAGSQGIKRATVDQLTRSHQKSGDGDVDELTNQLFKRFCQAAADTSQPQAHYLNDDISMILEQSLDVKTWDAFVADDNKQLLLSQLLYIWYLGWQRGYAFTVEIDMLAAKKQGHDPRLVKTTPEQIRLASVKISETESTSVLAEIFHDSKAQERVYLMLLAYLKTGRQK